MYEYHKEIKILNARPTSKIARGKVIICDGPNSHVVSPIWYSPGQMLTNIFCKGPDYKYLSFEERVFVATLQPECENIHMQYVKEWV